MDLRDFPDCLVEILRGYAVLCSPRYMRFPSELAFAQVHDFLLNGLLLSPQFTAYPPSPEYQKGFWKWSIEKLEEISVSEDDEIDERLYEHSIHLLQRVGSAHQAVGAPPPAPSFFTYIWPFGISYETCTLMESRTTIESGTTGMKTWRASLVLAQYLIQHSELVRARSVLELGSGVGLLGLILASLQQSDMSRGRIMLTDVNPHVLSRCEDNLALPCNLSSNHPHIDVEELDWTDALQDLRRPITQAVLQKASPDVVIGADVVFDPSIIPALVETLKMALTDDQSRFALIALTVRNKSTIAEFLHRTESVLKVEEVTDVADEASFWGSAHSGDTDHRQVVRIFKLGADNEIS